jgi:hypothetical protein
MSKRLSDHFLFANHFLSSAIVGISPQNKNFFPSQIKEQYWFRYPACIVVNTFLACLLTITIGRINIYIQIKFTV